MCEGEVVVVVVVAEGSCATGGRQSRCLFWIMERFKTAFQREAAPPAAPPAAPGAPMAGCAHGHGRVRRVAAPMLARSVAAVAVVAPGGEVAAAARLDLDDCKYPTFILSF